MNAKKRIYGPWLGAAATVAVVVGGLAVAGEREENEARVALPVEQVVACVRAAVEAKPGDVHAVEAERENGRTLCEVEIVATDGTLYEVSVEAATGKVVEVEDGEDDDEEDD